MRQLATVSGAEELREFYRDTPLGVRANMIFSADGAAAFGGRAGPLSCPADQRLLRELRGYADVVLVGAGTARAERYGPVRLSAEQLAERHAEGRTALPPLAVVSQTGRLPDSMFTEPTQRPILITSARAAEEHGLASDYRRSVLIAGQETVEVACALDTLRSHDMHRVLCEGGPTLLHEIVEADLLTEICMTVAPHLAGSQPIGAAPASSLTFPLPLRLAHTLVHDGYLFNRYVRAGDPGDLE